MTKKPEGQGSFKARRKLRNEIYAAVKTGGTLTSIAEAKGLTVQQVKRQISYLKRVKKYGSGRGKKKGKRGSYKPRSLSVFSKAIEQQHHSYELMLVTDDTNKLIQIIALASKIGISGMRIK